MCDLLAPPHETATVDHAVLLAEYATYLAAAGYRDHKGRLWGARVFLRRYPDLQAWRAAPLAAQCALPRNAKYFAHFLFLHHQLRPTMAYLLAARPHLAFVEEVVRLVKIGVYQTEHFRPCTERREHTLHLLDYRLNYRHVFSRSNFRKGVDNAGYDFGG